MRRLNLVSVRMGHHAGVSGYDRVIDYLPEARVFYSAKNENYSKRVVGRLGKRWISRSGLQWYHRVNFITESELCLSWLRDRRAVYHFLYGENSFRYLGIMKKWRGDNRIVATFHTPGQRFGEVVRTREHLRRLDAVVVVSTVQIDLFEQVLGRGAVHYVPHGIDVDFYAPARVPKDSDETFNCLFVGSHLRDTDTLIQVAARCAREDPQIGIHVVTLPKYAARFSPCDNVRVYSGVPDETLLELYRCADVLLLPLLDCTANNAILEALATGLPIISTDLQGVKDYVTEECSILCPPGDADGLFEAVMKLRSDPTLKKAMGARSRERAMDFRWERIAGRLEDIYASLWD